MTDPIREAFERWRDTKPHMSPLSVWQAAWRASRREALMEAAEKCHMMARERKSAIECSGALRLMAAAEEEEEDK